MSETLKAVSRVLESGWVLSAAATMLALSLTKAHPALMLVALASFGVHVFLAAAGDDEDDD